MIEEPIRRSGTTYIATLPKGAVITEELWKIITMNMHDPDKLQSIIDELFHIPPKH